ncbi:MAG TPA: LLM class F420-dependent oxidoreductase [Ilumatobacteraceae bacterium]|jgi:F420-dependent oxidoreductase-like protein|nr:LLM class F420-dependent oxidoreductase [Ilumatobacteraceae bacterium]
MATYGLQLPDFSWIVDADPPTTMDRLRDAAEAADASGFSSLWVMDHLMQLPPLGGPTASILEGYVTLGALAAVTKRVELGTLVTGVTYRNPALLAKQIATLDALSGGRVILGIGAAWYDVEHAAYGWEFPPVKERFGRLQEAVAICRGMFDNETFTFSGTYYSVDEARVVPRPQRRIPIMIGGSGEKKTLKMVAELADLCNVGGTAGVVGRKLAILDEHCAAVGRDPGEVKRTAMTTLFVSANDADRDALRGMLNYDNDESIRDRMIIATADEATENLAAIVAAGADEVIVNLPLIKSVDAIHIAAEVLKAAT